MELPSKLLNRNYLLLLQGQFISRIGANLFLFAMALFVKNETQSASLMGVMMMVAALPGVILGPIAGTVVDRYSRRKIVILCDLLNSLAVFAFAVFVYFNPGATKLSIGALMVIAVFNGIINSFFLPAIAAAIPDIVPHDKLAAANSLGQLTLQLSLFLGQGVGSFLYSILATAVIAFINGCTYLYAGISKIFIKIPQHIPEKSREWRDQLKHFKQDLIVGLKYVWKIKGLKIAVLISALLSFFSAPIVILIPFFIQNSLKVGDQWYGILVTIMGVGSLVGYLLTGVVKIEPRRRGLLMIIFMILNSTLYGFLGLTTHLSVAIGILFAAGVLSGFITVNITVIMQIKTPTEIRGRVFAFLATINGSLMPLGMGLGGIVADLLNKDIPLIFISCSVIMVGLTVLAAFSHHFREYLVTDRQAVPIMGGQNTIVPSESN